MTRRLPERNASDRPSASEVDFGTSSASCNASCAMRVKSSILTVPAWAAFRSRLATNARISWSPPQDRFSKTCSSTNSSRALKPSPIFMEDSLLRYAGTERYQEHPGSRKSYGLKVISGCPYGSVATRDAHILDSASARRGRMSATRSCNFSPDAFILRGKRIEIDQVRIVVGTGLAVGPVAAMNVNQSLDTPGIQIVHMLMLQCDR